MSDLLPPGSVVITPEQMFAELRETHAAVARIEQALATTPGDIADHEARLRLLEHWTWRAAGIATAVSVVLSSAVGVTVSLLASR